MSKVGTLGRYINISSFPNDPHGQTFKVPTNWWNDLISYLIDLSKQVTNYNKGYYATEADLVSAHPNANPGDFAVVGSTDTVWIFDVSTGQWVNSSTGTIPVNTFDSLIDTNTSGVQAGYTLSYIGNAWTATNEVNVIPGLTDIGTSNLQVGDVPPDGANYSGSIQVYLRGRTGLNKSLHPIDNSIEELVGLDAGGRLTRLEKSSLEQEVPTNLSDLANVSTDLPSSGDIFYYNGANWTPATQVEALPASMTLDFTSSVNWDQDNIYTGPAHTGNLVGLTYTEQRYLYVWDGSNWHRIDKVNQSTQSTVNVLNDLQNVNTSALQDEDVLVYDSTTGTWRNETPATLTLNSVSDVDTTGAASGDILIYNGSTWVIQTPDDLNLADNSDVDLTTPPVLNDVLTFDGTTWIAQAPSTGGATTLNDLTDVDTTGGFSGDFLGLVGSTWRPLELIINALGDCETTGDTIRIGSGSQLMGSQSVVLGTLASSLVTGPGVRTVVIGHGAGRSATDLGSSITIGYNAGNSSDGANNIYIGPNAGRTFAGNNNIIIGNAQGETVSSNFLVSNASGDFIRIDRSTSVGAVNAGPHSIATIPDLPVYPSEADADSDVTFTGGFYLVQGDANVKYKL